jgi:ABC-type protease/lipase transport system fused ATPase/permease subunit
VAIAVALLLLLALLPAVRLSPLARYADRIDRNLMADAPGFAEPTRAVRRAARTRQQVLRSYAREL